MARGSIALQKSLAKGMDCRVKPGNDSNSRHCESRAPYSVTPEFKQSACGLYCALLEPLVVMGSLLSQGRRGNFVVTAVNALQNIKGPIVLAGAGKMGGAMLAGWLARGADARPVARLRAKPSGENRARPAT